MATGKRLAALLLLILAPLAGGADTVELAPGHPDRYTVQRGDTLWGIAQRFLRRPWHWPEIWEVNPSVRNPHLIYPGDLLVLTYRNGRPVLSRQGGGVVKLSPRVRFDSVDAGAIPTIPINAIAPFLTRTRVVAEGELQASPYIVSVGGEHLVGSAGFRVYARGDGWEAADRYAVYRQGQAYVDPLRERRILGYEAVHVADAVVEKRGDPVTLYLTSSNRAVLSGDRVLPLDDAQIDTRFVPRAPDEPISGQIISVVDGVTQVGQFAVVALNLGRADGIEAGHVLAVYQRGRTIRDPYAPKEGNVGDDSVVTLPDENAGIVMVFRPYESLSYGLVMKATRAMHVGDVVKNP